MQINGTMMQYFEWYLPSGKLWKQLKQQAPELARNGITAVWIPPAYKASGGAEDVGYAPYDLWDLGEFEQKGTLPTKYGTKAELKAAIEALHENGVQVYADIVLDHKMGADEEEEVIVREVDPNNRVVKEGDPKPIMAATHFFFPGRQKKHSDFEWHWYHFSGVDGPDGNGGQAVYLFEGKEWAKEVDGEKGNFDYLMGADLDLSNPEVMTELTRWGKWFLKETGVDGFRFDAVKHMKFGFYKNWLHKLRENAEEELFSVGEYWNGSVDALTNYIRATEERFSLFDVPLHYRLLNAATSNGEFDMRTIFDDTLTKAYPNLSVTFVDNHDTQPGQSLESFIPDWFKLQAYSLILLREAGYPCVFYGDYYGIPHSSEDPKKSALDKLLRARHGLAYGEQRDFFEDRNLIGWTREGDDAHPDSGLAVLLTNGSGGTRQLFIGEKNAGRYMRQIFDEEARPLRVDEAGHILLDVPDASVRVWRFLTAEEEEALPEEHITEIPEHVKYEPEENPTAGAAEEEEGAGRQDDEESAGPSAAKEEQV